MQKQDVARSRTWHPKVAETTPRFVLTGALFSQEMEGGCHICKGGQCTNTNRYNVLMSPNVQRVELPWMHYLWFEQGFDPCLELSVFKFPTHPPTHGLGVSTFSPHNRGTTSTFYRTASCTWPSVERYGLGLEGSGDFVHCTSKKSNC